MIQKQINFGNKLIAIFDSSEPEVLRRDLLKAGTIECMQYHSSWDWLMPVVNKITAEKYFDDYPENTLFWDKYCEISLIPIWFACVKYVQWKNKLKLFGSEL